jgi:biopolymer transport protein ExbD
MGAVSEDRADGQITGINITPLVDVVLVLLIIFMATAPLIQRRALNVNVPRAAHHERRATRALAVLFTEDRRVLVEKESLALDQVSGALRRRLRVEPDLQVSVAAEAGLPYGEVVALLDEVRGAGVKKVALEVRAKK